MEEGGTRRWGQDSEEAVEKPTEETFREGPATCGREDDGGNGCRIWPLTFGYTWTPLPLPASGVCVFPVFLGGWILLWCQIPRVFLLSLIAWFPLPVLPGAQASARGSFTHGSPLTVTFPPELSTPRGHPQIQ